ncbi:TonB-dependent receptor [Parasphingopyxis algicola]|uniref:TonB-dependent receptor domain-containing protein n=1 Tax=Parasphingopyxis algicola TaxID=2026624 RepID=UPI0015A22F89|nr:TonB-dependent receptor [Parasphingopyxis algicola]QLC24755.1 TonB-dependent receptor [Parasphingopyxis algicola]
MGSAAFGVVTTPALAQSSDELAAAGANSQPAIVVTGSRITNPNLEQSSPIQVVGQDEIDYRQATNAEDLLSELPGVIPGTSSTTNNGATGIATLNLRGLGTVRNLVLLDGTRLVPSTPFSQTDLNIIPVALVERVEIVTGGAASVYGADAIAGVANFVTRRDFEGLEAAATFGITERGDGERIRGDLTLGANFDDGRGNAVLSIGYQEVDSILQANRLISQGALGATTGLIGGSGTTVPTRIDGLQLDPNTETLVPTFNSFNYAPFNFFQTPLTRYNAYASARYEVTPGIEVYSRAMFTKSNVRAELAPAGLFGISLAIPLNNPFLNDTLAQQICANATVPVDPATCTAARTATDSSDPNFVAVPVTVNRRLVEQGPRRSSRTSNQFQLWAGVRGDISDTISYDVGASYGEVDLATALRGNGLRSRVEQALLATSPTTCEDPSNGCFPLNLFGGGVGTNIDPRYVAFSDVATLLGDSVTLATATGSLNGTFGETGFFTETPIGFAVGVEYREYNATRTADVPNSTQGEILGNGAPAPSFAGTYDVIEGFAELIVPILEDVPGFYSLQVEGGIRVSDYSNTGTSVTWKAGGSWEPFEGFRFRGIFQRSVRSPNIGELFLPQSIGLTGLTTDPCQLGNPVGNATLTAICIAQGAPSNTIGRIPAPNAAQANATSGGNPNLDVETADSFTIGLVATPPQVPGLIVSIDYYNIKVSDAITTPNPGDILVPCFGPNNDGNGTDPSACNQIFRNPLNGGLSGGPDTPGLFLGLTNQGTLETSGVDFRITYTHPVSFGSLNFDLNGNWTDEQLFQASPTAINRECTGFFSGNCLPIQPEWTINLRTTVSIDDLVDISLLYRWIDNVIFEPIDPTPGILERFRAIDDASYFDLSIRSNVSENFDVTLSIFNLLDRDPPNISQDIGPSSINSGNTYPGTYDPQGRRYSVTGRLRF